MDFKIFDKSIIKRALTGFIVGLISLFCICFGGLPLLLYVMLISVIGSLEFVKILNCKGFYPFKTVIIIFSNIFLILAALKEYSLIPIVATTATICSFLSVIFKGRQPYIANVATTVLGFLYCGLLPAHIIMIRQISASPINLLTLDLNDGLVYLFIYFFGVIVTDIGAFYFGKNFGKRKLAPIISPNKTIEGSLGAIFSTLIVSGAISLYTGLSIIHAIILPILISVAAQLGDLAESLIKRDAGVKDSGDSLPGHGGILDRTDGYIFAAPVVFYYVHYFILNNHIFINMGKSLLNVFG